MKLKHLFIKSYSQILQNRDFEFKPGFNLIFGQNEQGKSLTLDALVKLLVGKDSKNFEKIDRVDVMPQQFGGYLELELQQNQDNKYIKLQGDHDLSELIGISSQDCQNIFIIRNSDLSIGRDINQEQHFYTNLTDRLTGLKTDQINQLKQILLNRAHLTDKTHQFSNDQDSQKLGQRLEQAQKLVEEEGIIQRLLDKDKTDHWSQLIETEVNLRLKLGQIETKIKNLNLARKREDYETITTNLNQLKKLQIKLKNFKGISLKQRDKWKEAQQNLKNWQNRKQELALELEEIDHDISQIETQEKEISQKNQILEQRYNQIKSNYVPVLEELKEKKTRISKGKNLKQTWILGTVINSFILAAALISLILTSNLIISSIVSLSLAGTAFSLYKLYSLNKTKADFASQLEELKLDLNQFKIEGADLSQLTAEVHSLSESFEQTQSQLRETEAKLKQKVQYQQKIKNNKISKTEQKIDTIKNQIKQIKNDSQVNDVKSYQKKLQQKQDFIAKLKQHQKILEDKLNQKNKPLSHQLKSWSKQLKQLVKYKNKAQNFRFSEQELDQAQNQREATNQKLSQVTKKLERYQQTLKKVKQKVQAILLNHEQVAVESLADLHFVQEQLGEFINHHQQQREQTLKTIELLKQIEDEEKQKISSLFGQESTISDYYQQITGGRYQQVDFNQDMERIEVVTSDNLRLVPSQLSSGAYDQLYFSIRLGLAQKLLKNKTGFLVLDDPFIKADQTRIKRQIKMLADLAKQGWQIIYFSAKEEIKAEVTQLDHDYNLIQMNKLAN